MPNGREHMSYEVDFGKHKYADHDGTSDCKFGKCPRHVLRETLPTSLGKPIGSEGIMGDFVNGRISYLESEVYGLRPYKKIVDEAEAESNADLVSKLADAGDKVHTLTAQLEAIKSGMLTLAS